MNGWLKPKTAAEYCDISERTMRAWLKDEGLRSSRVRGSILIKISWIDAFLKEHELDSSDKVERIVDQVCTEMEI